MFEFNDCKFKLQNRMLEQKVWIQQQQVFEFWRGWIPIDQEVESSSSGECAVVL